MNTNRAAPSHGDVERQSLAVELAARLRAIGARQDCLDDLVIDVFAERSLSDVNATNDEAEQDASIAEAEGQAAEINNQGFEAQCLIILEGWGLDEGTRRILEDAGLEAA